MNKSIRHKTRLISLIVPAFKQQNSIQKDILRIKNVMDQLRYDYEIIVVVDGFIDRTYQEAKKQSSEKIIVMGYQENAGKGHAIRYGISKARGDIVGFIDSGMDINPNGVSMLLEHFEWYNADIIVGSKLHPVSKVDYPLSRKVLSWGYRQLVKVLFGVSVRDTQVGMKFFRRKVLEDIMPRLLVKTYAFDIEILAVAYHLGYKRIFEAPIDIKFRKNSITSMNLWRIIFWMLWDTFAVYYRLKIVRYYDISRRDKSFGHSELRLEPQRRK